MTTLTPNERDLARHALGLTQGKRRAWRNHYVADGGPDHDTWFGLVARGLATRRRGSPLTGDMDLFRLTLAGAEAALRPGETLDPKLFAPADRSAA